MKYTFASLALAALSLASPVPEAAVAAPPAFKIKNVVYGGSGCPQGSLDISFTDSKLLPIYFSKEFTARVGSGVSVEEARKNCQLNINLEYSPGYSFSIFSVDYSGWADLDSGVTGLLRSNYYFSGYTEQTSLSQNIVGPFHGKYIKHDEVSESRWSPCGSSSLFNINSEIALSPIGQSPSGTLVATRESARFTQVFYIKWKEC